MLLTSVICFTYFSVYAETNTLKAGILDDYSFDGNSISEYAEDSVNTILDTTASTNFIANEINFDDTTFNKGYFRPSKRKYRFFMYGSCE